MFDFYNIPEELSIIPLMYKNYSYSKGTTMQCKSVQLNIRDFNMVVYDEENKFFVLKYKYHKQALRFATDKLMYNVNK
jgi:hypothetical protein